MANSEMDYMNIGKGNIKNNDGDIAQIRCFSKTASFSNGNATIPISDFEGVTTIDCAFAEIRNSNFTVVCRAQISGSNLSIRALNCTVSPPTGYTESNVTVDILLVYR